MGPKYYGPYKVLAAITPVSYRLALPPHLRHHPVIHVSALKPFSGSANPSTFRDPPPPDLIDGELHFHVEAFLNDRGSGRRRRFLVKWTGYDDVHNDWVPATRLRDDLDPATFHHLLSALHTRLRRPPPPLPPPPASPTHSLSPLAPPFLPAPSSPAHPSLAATAPRPASPPAAAVSPPRFLVRPPPTPPRASSAAWSAVPAALQSVPPRRRTSAVPSLDTVKE